MAMTSTQDILDTKTRLIQSALLLAGNMSWSDVSMHDIAYNANVEMDNVNALFHDKDDIICAYTRQVDLKVKANLTGAFGDSDTQRDQLFDIIMERFDVLNENRAGVISIVNALTLDPLSGLNSLPNLCQSTTFMARLSGMNTDGWKGALRVTALCGVYLNALRTWVSDDTPDMAATMASVDKGLGYTSKINV